ncbi:WD-repeat protein [Reticulomyxa filosa]|uniref:WD-repeat protein n=1 Tax=Reticulomyxa filosa TaxID=46433 RepID=X6P7W0_RETFI|nr:WD-repeat protein [Reticulomyxa filosa]|eukprot:ETO34203.1 WD-repeat protein [Reticulomyxa filosa]
MITFSNEKQTATQQLNEEKKIQMIITYWVRILNIKLGWIHDFDKLVVNYAENLFMLDTFCSSSKLLKPFFGHTNYVRSIDYLTLDCGPLLCSGSEDKTVRVWDVENNKQIQVFNGHSRNVYCVKFSSYHYHNNRQNVICSSSQDSTIRFWNFKDNQQSQILNGHANGVIGIEFSRFNGGRYLCSGSHDNTIRLWDVKTSKSLHVLNGHKDSVYCVDISPLQSNKGNGDNNESNSIGVIGGRGYTICSGSWDTTIRIWDIETAKQFIVFKGHEDWINSVKYVSSRSGIIGGANTILSGSSDGSVRLWDIRSGQQIQIFNGHTSFVNAVEYSPLVVNNSDVGISNVICSGSTDNTIRFWDVRSNNNELYVIKGSNEKDAILCFKFLQFKKKEKKGEGNDSSDCNLSLCYGLQNGHIRMWG